MTVPELVDAAGSHAEPGSMRNEEIKAALQVRLAEDANTRAGVQARRAEQLALAAVGVSVLGLIVQVATS